MGLRIYFFSFLRLEILQNAYTDGNNPLEGKHR